MTNIAVALINLYQANWSPDHSPRRRLYPAGFCRFHPTCSEYTKQAILQFGIFHGTLLGVLRLARCHPWQRGGVDPVPTR